MNDVSRRQFVCRLSALIGMGAATALSSGKGMAVAFAYTRNPDSALRAGLVFSKRHMQTLTAVANAILPETDTPSAEQLDCHGFTDNQLAQCHSEDEQNRVKSCLDNIQQMAGQSDYSSLPLEQQQQILTQLESGQNAETVHEANFALLKSLVVFGFCTSQIGATQALRYDAVPGPFKGTIPYKKGDKAWSSLAYY